MEDEQARRVACSKAMYLQKSEARCGGGLKVFGCGPASCIVEQRVDVLPLSLMTTCLAFYYTFLCGPCESACLVLCFILLAFIGTYPPSPLLALGFIRVVLLAHLCLPFATAAFVVGNEII